MHIPETHCAREECRSPRGAVGHDVLARRCAGRGRSGVGGRRWRWRWRVRSEDERTAGQTPPAPRASLAGGRRVLAGVALFSLAVVLHSDSAYPTSSAHCSDEIDNLDDLPNEGELVLKIPRRHRPSAPGRLVRGNMRGHDERGKERERTAHRGLSTAEARREEEESEGEKRSWGMRIDGHLGSSYIHMHPCT
jgi:hypothetical protein